MTYNDFILSIQTLLVSITNNTDNNFTNLIPRMIEYGELRIYREFDFLATSSSQTATLTGSSRNVALPSNIIVLQSANVITPSSATVPDTGSRNMMTRVSLDFLNLAWPSSTPPGTPSIPIYYAEIGNPTIAATTTAGPINIVVGPPPDANYTVELIGTIRPSPLSPANQTTFLSVNVPDLFVAACMIFGAGAQRDYGAKSDDPQLALSWEQEYKTLAAGVNIEELRKKAQSVEWSSYQPSPIATQSRDRASGAPQ